MSSPPPPPATAQGQGTPEVPIGYRFRPKDNELVEFYLLPSARGEPLPFPGVLIEDDAAVNTPPWKLFQRHHLAVDDLAFFLVRTCSDAKGGGAREGRTCDGGGTWKGQRRRTRPLHVAGEEIEWSKNNLSLRYGKGSTGWVMHEYTITKPKPPCAPVKICSISFTGHGQKRKREPDEDDYNDDSQGESSMPQRPRVDAPAQSASVAPMILTRSCKNCPTSWMVIAVFTTSVPCQTSAAAPLQSKNLRSLFS